MRYQYMTPEDYCDDVAMGAADILSAFKGLTTTHGIPHIADARGKHTVVARERRQLAGGARLRLKIEQNRKY